MNWRPLHLCFFAPIVESKKDGESFRSNLFTIFVEAVGCRDHPGASDLQEFKQRSLDLKAHQSGAALGVDLIPPLVLVFDQSCYPRVGILLETIDVSP